MIVRVIIFVMYFSVIGISTSLAQDTLEDVRPVAERATVLLKVEFADAETETIKETEGSGVVISETGYILTAAHVVEEWERQTKEEKSFNHITAYAGDRYGSGREAGLLAMDSEHDIALLKLKGKVSVDSAPFCFVDAPQPGKLFLFGFPSRKNLTPIPAEYANQADQGEGWQIAVKDTFGVSGGPVFDSTGRVVALVKGGNSEVVGYVTPVKWGKSMVENYSDAEPSCTAGGSGVLNVGDHPAPVIPNVETIEPIIPNVNRRPIVIPPPPPVPVYK